MAGIYIFLSLSTLFAFIITRTVWVRIMAYGGWVLELHFSILALRIPLSPVKKADGGGPAPRFYARLIGRIDGLVRRSEVTVGRLAVPGRRNAGVGGYFWAWSAAIAYLASSARNMKIQDNAFTLISDSSAIEIDITARLPLYRLCIFGVAVLYDLLRQRISKRRK